MGTKRGQGIKVECVLCSAQFTGQGRRKTCSPECRDKLAEQQGRNQIRSCGNEICNEVLMPGVRKSKKYCSVDCRKYVAARAGSDVISYNQGYLRISGPSVSSHPTLSRGGTTRTMRHHVFVAFMTHGEGPHTCFWCFEEVHWMFGDKHQGPEKKKIVVDHLNGVRIDNRTDNLVLSCNPCNMLRSRYSSR